MPVLSPDHFFDQAERLMTALAAGPPRQVDLRRAISSAYYGVFHFALAEIADEFVGKSKRNLPRYAAVYRALDHRALKTACQELQKSPPPARYAALLPPNGMGKNIVYFAAAVIELQEKRHRADYDPASRFKTSDAEIAIRTARRAVALFKRAGAEQKKTFLTLLLCPPRQA